MSMERRLATVVAMDVVGYSRLMEQDEAGTLQRLKDMHSTLLAPAISGRGGRVVKQMGDGFLSEFPSVVDALQCAVDIQQQLSARNSTAPPAASCSSGSACISATSLSRVTTSTATA
jgi:adenylate cyclase